MINAVFEESTAKKSKGPLHGLKKRLGLGIRHTQSVPTIPTPIDEMLEPFPVTKNGNVSNFDVGSIATLSPEGSISDIASPPLQFSFDESSLPDGINSNSPALQEDSEDMGHPSRKQQQRRKTSLPMVNRLAVDLTSSRERTHSACENMQSMEFMDGSAPQLVASRHGTASSTDLAAAKIKIKKKTGFVSSTKHTIQSWDDLAGDAREMMIQFSNDLTRITNIATNTFDIFSSTAVQLNEILGANQPELTLPLQTLPTALQSVTAASGQIMLCAHTAQELLDKSVKPIFLTTIPETGQNLQSFLDGVNLRGDAVINRMTSASNDFKLLSERFAYALLAIIALVGLAVFEYYFHVNGNCFVRMAGEISFLLLISILIGCFISKMIFR